MIYSPKQGVPFAGKVLGPDLCSEERLLPSTLDNEEASSLSTVLREYLNIFHSGFTELNETSKMQRQSCNLFSWVINSKGNFNQINEVFCKC